jgi:hypothetical protein
MKNKKWVTYLLGTLLTLIALAVVGAAGFRIGIMQNADFPRMEFGERPAFDQNVDKNDPGAPNGNDDLGSNPRGNGLAPRGFDRGHRGMPMMGGLFGLIHIAILALLLWFGYKFIKNSGWRLIRIQNETPSTGPAATTRVEEEKESE